MKYLSTKERARAISVLAEGGILGARSGKTRLATGPRLLRYGTLRQTCAARLRIFQRPENASFAPSATNAAAKVRRIQVRTRGREMMRSRIEAANSP